jgi:NTE family protein
MFFNTTAKPKSKPKPNKSANKLANEGNQLFEEERYIPALNKYNESLTKDPTNLLSIQGKLKALKSLGQQKEAKGAHTDAKRYYEQAHLWCLANPSLYEDEGVAIEIPAELARLRQICYQEAQAKLAVSQESKKNEEKEKESGGEGLKGESINRQQYRYLIKRIFFEGGGIKGLGHVGAFEALLEYIDKSQLEEFGGASAGSIMACLLAVGYSAAELEEIMLQANFADFMDGPYREKLFEILDKSEKIKKFGQEVVADVKKATDISRPSTAVLASTRLVFYSQTDYSYAIKEALQFLQKDQFGLFPGDYFREQWLEPLLQQKTGIPYLTLGELRILSEAEPECFKALYVMVCNITKRLTQVLSHVNAGNYIISDLIRCSISIPLIFNYHQYYIKVNGLRVPHPDGDRCVDGGTLDNYAPWIFDYSQTLDNQGPKNTADYSHTLGLRFTSVPEEFSNATSLPGHIWQLLQTILNKQNSDYLNHREYLRTINIDSLGFTALQFNLDPHDQARLLESGRQKVHEHFDVPALIVALEEGDSVAVRRLIQSGCALDGTTPAGDSLLDIAFEYKHFALAILLLQSGVYTSKQPEKIAEMLEDALQSPFVDKQELTEILQRFRQHHTNVFQQERTFSLQ